MDIPAARPFFSEEDIKEISHEVTAILKSGRLILGPYTREFENKFAEYIGVQHAVAVSSCTAALEICLQYYGVQDKEVIVPTNTFLATSNSVLYSGGRPVLADIRPDTLCIDPEDLLTRVTAKTRGVIIVHVAGLPCPDTEIVKTICRERGLFLIEDAAHSHGATINGKKTGSLADAGCFSFYPTKVVTTCTGGMITTDNPRLADFAISLRHHGVGQGLHDIINLGNDWLMDEISALLGIFQLKALENNLSKRNEIAARYTKALQGFPGLLPFPVPPNIRHSYYKYAVLLSPAYSKADLIKHMSLDYGVSLGSIYDPPCHLQPVYQRLFETHRGMFPRAEDTLSRTFCLPLYPQLSDEEVEHTLKSLKAVISRISLPAAAGF